MNERAFICFLLTAIILVAAMLFMDS